METMKLSELSLHRITETHPKMSEDQYKAFKADIANGQKLPVFVYRGKIVDGRHRYRALSELGVDEIKVIHLANNTTMVEIAGLADSTEFRRHQTPTQLAIRGYKLYKLGGLNQKESAAATGCSLANLKHIVSLESMGRVDLVDWLWSGGKVDVSRDTRFNKMTDSLLAIVTYVKEQKANLAAIQVEEIEEDEEPKEASGKLTETAVTQLQAVELLTTAWDDKMKMTLIAKLYKSMSQTS